jgi:hypothetical protein
MPSYFYYLGSYWLAKVTSLDEKTKDLEVQYFDDNTLGIESTSTEIVPRSTVLCEFGKIHHSCKQFKLSDALQSKLIQQVAIAAQCISKKMPTPASVSKVSIL